MIQRLVHRDRRWFDDPETFKPERWDNDLIKALAPLRVFPLRRWPAHLHRQPLRDDGGRASPGHDCPAISSRDRARPDPRSSCHRSRFGRVMHFTCGSRPMGVSPHDQPARLMSLSVTRRQFEKLPDPPFREQRAARCDYWPGLSTRPGHLAANDRSRSNADS